MPDERPGVMMPSVSFFSGRRNVALCVVGLTAGWGGCFSKNKKRSSWWTIARHWRKPPTDAHLQGSEPADAIDVPKNENSSSPGLNVRNDSAGY